MGLLLASPRTLEKVFSFEGDIRRGGVETSGSGVGLDAARCRPSATSMSRWVDVLGVRRQRLGSTGIGVGAVLSECYLVTLWLASSANSAVVVTYAVKS